MTLGTKQIKIPQLEESYFQSDKPIFIPYLTGMLFLNIILLLTS